MKKTRKRQRGAHGNSSSTDSEVEIVPDHSKVVQAVAQQHKEMKRIKAGEILENNLDKNRLLIDAALFEYQTAVWDPSESSNCRITKAHNDIWALNPAQYRNSINLYQIRHHSDKIQHTFYHMKSDGKYRRVSIDGEVFKLIFRINDLSLSLS